MLQNTDFRWALLWNKIWLLLLQRHGHSCLPQDDTSSSLRRCYFLRCKLLAPIAVVIHLRWWSMAATEHLWCNNATIWVWVNIDGGRWAQVMEGLHWIPPQHTVSLRVEYNAYCDFSVSSCFKLVWVSSISLVQKIELNFWFKFSQVWFTRRAKACLALIIIQKEKMGNQLGHLSITSNLERLPWSTTPVIRALEKFA